MISPDIGHFMTMASGGETEFSVGGNRSQAAKATFREDFTGLTDVGRTVRRRQKIQIDSPFAPNRQFKDETVPLI